MEFLLLSTVAYTAPLCFRFTLWRPYCLRAARTPQSASTSGLPILICLYIFIYWKQTIAMFNGKRQKLSGHEYKKRREARKQDAASLTTINHFLIPLRIH